MSKPRISVFPKCYFDEICKGEMPYLEWIRSAASLGAEGLEHYDGFFKSLEDADVDPIISEMENTKQISSLLCFSPDFTHPDPDERQRQVERQKAAIDLCVKMGMEYCRTLSGQAYPDLDYQDGIERTRECILRSLEYAEKKGVTLCMENHYKDGNWQYPEFAQPEEIFLEIIEKIDSPFFGVQYDPSNATVGAYDPIEFLKKVKHRVVSMHASDRRLAEGASLEDLKSADGQTGYSDKLIHGEVGTGLNDFDTIFKILAEADYKGWISVEDGMNGLAELERSIEFLKNKREEYF